MTPRALGNIHTTRNKCRDTHAWHGTKTILVFLPADVEASWSLLPCLASFTISSTLEPENTYSCILKVTGQVWEIQKGISISTLIIATTSAHISLSQSQLWSNKFRFSFNQPNRKRWGMKLVNIIKHLPHKVFLLWYHH